MNPATLQLVLTLLSQVPNLVAAAASVRGTLSTTDQAQLDAAIDAAQKALNTDIDTLIADAQARS